MIPFAAAMLLASTALSGGGGYTSGELITNPSGASGTTGWVQTRGANFGTGSGAGLGATNFILSTNASTDKYSEVVQIIDVPSGGLSYAAAGMLKLTFGFTYNTSATDVDGARIVLICYDATGGGGNVIDYIMSPGDVSTYYNDNTATPVSVAFDLPAGTLSVGVGFYGSVVGGTELSFYWASTSVVMSSSTTKRFPVFSPYTASETGWTVTTGSITGTTSNAANGGNPTAIPYQFFGGSQVGLAYYRDIAATADMLTAIAAGATLHMSRVAYNTNGGDKSRLFIQCLDASNTVLATLQDAAAATNWTTTLNWFGGTVAIPSGTTKFRVNQLFTRVDGTVDDARVGLIQVWMTA